MTACRMGRIASGGPKGAWIRRLRASRGWCAADRSYESGEGGQEKGDKGTSERPIGGEARGGALQYALRDERAAGAPNECVRVPMRRRGCGRETGFNSW